MQRLARNIAKRAHRVRGRGGIGRIGLDQQFGMSAADEIAAEIGGDFDDEGNLALRQQAARDFRRVRRADDVEIAGVVQRRDDRVGEGARIGDRNRRRQMLGDCRAGGSRW